MSSLVPRIDKDLLFQPRSRTERNHDSTYVHVYACDILDQPDSPGDLPNLSYGRISRSQLGARCQSRVVGTHISLVCGVSKANRQAGCLLVGIRREIIARFKET